jgi:hypothetical protein
MLCTAVESYGQLKERLELGDEHPVELSRRARRLLLASIAVTLLLHVIPLGGFLIYPLMLLSTLVHELGHGVTALAVGGEFQNFQMWADGSGMARWNGDVSAGGRALISAGGLVGPALVAGIGFLAARRKTAARVAMGLGALALLAAEILVVRNAFGLVFVGLLVASMGWLLVRKSAPTVQTVLVFLAVQLSLSVFSRGDYLFTDTAVTAAGDMPSDVAHIAQALGGPYWLWGLLIGAFSLMVLAGGTWLFLEGTPRPLAGVLALFRLGPRRAR